MKVVYQEAKEAVEQSFCDRCGCRGGVSGISGRSRKQNKLWHRENGVMCDAQINTFVATFGYGSCKDGNTQEFDLCEKCYDKLVKVLSKFGVQVRVTREMSWDNQTWFRKYLDDDEKKAFDRAYRPRVGRAVARSLVKYGKNQTTLAKLLGTTRPLVKAMLAKRFDHFTAQCLQEAAEKLGVNTDRILGPLWKKYGARAKKREREAEKERERKREEERQKEHAA